MIYKSNIILLLIITFFLSSLNLSAQNGIQDKKDIRDSIFFKYDIHKDDNLSKSQRTIKAKRAKMRGSEFIGEFKGMMFLNGGFGRIYKGFYGSVGGEYFMSQKVSIVPSLIFERSANDIVIKRNWSVGVVGMAISV